MITLDSLKERPLSYSSLKAFAVSPKHYINYLNKPRKQTPELLFGQLLHSMLLEPTKFNDEYIISRKFDMRKKDDKAEYDKMVEESIGKTIVQQDLHEEVFNLVELVRSNKDFRDLMSANPVVETREYKEIFGLPFVIIKDISIGDRTIDIKSVQNASLETITKDFFNYQYYLQAAIYGGDFSFYIVEKNEPYYNGLLPISQNFIDYGKSTLERLCVAFNYALEHPESFDMAYEFWDKFNGNKRIINLPPWVK